MSPQKTYLAFTILGTNRNDLIAQLTNLISEHECMIATSQAMAMGEECALMMLVEGKWNNLARLENALPDLSRQLDFQILHKRTSEKDKSHSLAYSIEGMGLAHPELVHAVTSFFAKRNISVEDLSSVTFNSIHTGAPILSLRMTVTINADVLLSVLRDEFMDYCDDMNFDAIMEPLKF